MCSLFFSLGREGGKWAFLAPFAFLLSISSFTFPSPKPVHSLHPSEGLESCSDFHFSPLISAPWFFSPPPPISLSAPWFLPLCFLLLLLYSQFLFLYILISVSPFSSLRLFSHTHFTDFLFPNLLLPFSPHDLRVVITFSKLHCSFVSFGLQNFVWFKKKVANKEKKVSLNRSPPSSRLLTYDVTCI